MLNTLEQQMAPETADRHLQFHEAVRKQLERILRHPLFARSERLVRFLRLAVGWALDGKASEIKEYLIGMEVFDRKDSYDPRMDPIVRVEARRLRAKLKAYYDGDGRCDAVVLEFRPGSYAPCFRLRHREAMSVAVTPFLNFSPNPEDAYFSDALTEELIHVLMRAPGMRVAAWTGGSGLTDRQEEIREVRRRLNADKVVTGSVRIVESSLRVRAQAVDTETGEYLWSETFDRQMNELFGLQEELALTIVDAFQNACDSIPPPPISWHSPMARPGAAVGH